MSLLSSTSAGRTSQKVSSLRNSPHKINKQLNSRPISQMSTVKLTFEKSLQTTGCFGAAGRNSQKSQPHDKYSLTHTESLLVYM